VIFITIPKDIYRYLIAISIAIQKTQLRMCRSGGHSKLRGDVSLGNGDMTATIDVPVSYKHSLLRMVSQN
jgi:hypothetical protein